jgi:hypothetical protein
VPKRGTSAKPRDLEFGTDNGTVLKAFRGDSGHFGEEARKGTKSGRSPLAAFYVRLLREGLLVLLR